MRMRILCNLIIANFIMEVSTLSLSRVVQKLLLLLSTIVVSISIFSNLLPSVKGENTSVFITAVTSCSCILPEIFYVQISKCIHKCSLCYSNSNILSLLFYTLVCDFKICFGNLFISEYKELLCSLKDVHNLSVLMYIFTSHRWKILRYLLFISG